VDCDFEELNMARWKRLTDVGNSGIEIDLDTIAFMHVNGTGTQITFNTGRTLTVRESPEDVAMPKKPTNVDRWRQPLSS
jgi:hypothetical protein